MHTDNKAFLKAHERKVKAFMQSVKKGKGDAKVAAPGGPAARLTESVELGYGFEIDSIDFVATDEGYFNVAAQLTLAIRPAFRRVVEVLRKVLPEMVREKLDGSRVIQDLKNQESELVAVLGLADSASNVSDLIEHIVKNIRVRITTVEEAVGKSDFQVPQILWGIGEDKLMEVGGWGAYTSYPSKDSIDWAVWLLQNSYRKSGHRVKFGAFSGRQSRTRRAIMIPGGSFSLTQYIDPYEVNFVADIIDENLAVKVQQIAEKIITQEIAKIPQVDIGKTAGLLQLKAGKAVHISVGDTTRPIEAVAKDADLIFGVTADIISKLKELADAKLITQEEASAVMHREINIDTLMGRLG